MGLFGEYDAENIFAKILRGEVPSYKIYEDDDVLAFLDLFPQSRGHSLVIPKDVQARNILEIEPDKLSRLILAVQKLTRVVVEELQPEGVQIAQLNGSTAGQSVFHIHFHIVPRFSGQSLGKHAQNKADPVELEALQARLVKRVQALGL